MENWSAAINKTGRLDDEELAMLAEAGRIRIPDQHRLHEVAEFWLNSYSHRIAGLEIADSAEALATLLKPLSAFFDDVPTVGRDHFYYWLDKRLIEGGFRHGVLGFENSIIEVLRQSRHLRSVWHPGPGRSSGDWTKPYLMVLMAEYRRLSGSRSLPSVKSHHEMPSNAQYRFVCLFSELIANASHLALHATYLDREKTLGVILTQRAKSHLSLLRLLDEADRDFALVTEDWAKARMLPSEAVQFLSLVGSCKPRGMQRARTRKLSS